jgi:putative endonuclease
MSVSNRDIGIMGEDLAVKYLKRNNYKILERNFRCRMGEIDIVAKDKDYICFVEVKTRFCTAYGSPAEAVTRAKQHKISSVAQYYILKRNYFDLNCRFDVVEILINNKQNGYASIGLIKDAFEL